MNRQPDHFIDGTGIGENAGTQQASSFARRTWIAALWLVSGPLFAHVSLLAPNGGEILAAGTPVSIDWQVDVSHDTLNWDLWYSVSGDAGPWIPIALDLPPGDTTTGAQHSFEWIVPDAPSIAVRVRVQQDNSDMDYEDQSDSDLTIESSAAIFLDGFETGDTSMWD